MLRTNEKGEFITIENVFHSLNTRLGDIKRGINDSIDIEILANWEDPLYFIKTQIYGYHPAIGLQAIGISLFSIDRIFEKITKIQESENEISADSQLPPESWGVPRNRKKEVIAKVVNEINFYKDYLGTLKLELSDILTNTTEVNLNSTNEKIKINPTIEQFGALLYFLNGGEDKIFNTDLKPLCRALITIFRQNDGTDFKNEEYLYNKTYGLKIRTINFWRDKFIHYMNRCNDLRYE